MPESPDRRARAAIAWSVRSEGAGPRPRDAAEQARYGSQSSGFPMALHGPHHHPAGSPRSADPPPLRNPPPAQTQLTREQLTEQRAPWRRARPLGSRAPAADHWGEGASHARVDPIRSSRTVRPLGTARPVFRWSRVAVTALEARAGPGSRTSLRTRLPGSGRTDTSLSVEGGGPAPRRPHLAPLRAAWTARPKRGEAEAAPDSACATGATRRAGSPATARGSARPRATRSDGASLRTEPDRHFAACGGRGATRRPWGLAARAMPAPPRRGTSRTTRSLCRPLPWCGPPAPPPRTDWSSPTETSSVQTRRHRLTAPSASRPPLAGPPYPQDPEGLGRARWLVTLPDRWEPTSAGPDRRATAKPKHCRGGRCADSCALRAGSAWTPPPDAPRVTATGSTRGGQPTIGRA